MGVFFFLPDSLINSISKGDIVGIYSREKTVTISRQLWMSTYVWRSIDPSFDNKNRSNQCRKLSWTFRVSLIYLLFSCRKWNIKSDFFLYLSLVRMLQSKIQSTQNGTSDSWATHWPEALRCANLFHIPNVIRHTEQTQAGGRKSKVILVPADRKWITRRPPVCQSIHGLCICQVVHVDIIRGASRFNQIGFLSISSII